MNKTYIPKQETKHKWYVIDAKNQNLGRLSTKIATILRGKNEVTYTPYLTNQSHIIITNAQAVHVTGQKRSQKVYRRHSGRPGGLKEETFERLQKRMPTRIIEKSVKGMLPKGPLGRKLFTQLKVYAGNEHPHSAQNPEVISLN